MVCTKPIYPVLFFITLLSNIHVKTANLDQHLYLQNLKKNFGKGAIKNMWLSYALKGENVFCPCCRKKFLTFVPAGLQKRSNARCVNCNALERHRTIWMYLEEKTNFFTAPLKVMNVAPESFFYQKFSSQPNLDYYAVDKYPEKYGYGPRTIRMDITEMEFADNSFDVVICNHVLEHVQDDMKAMREIYRVLKPGGWAILNSPVDKKRQSTYEDASITDPILRLQHFGQQDHVRVYGTDYINRLLTAGFEVKVIDYAETFSHNDQFRYGLKADEEIYHCYKK